MNSTEIYPSLHDRLKNQHEAIENIIENLDETRLTIQPGPDKWSIKDNIAHLARYQPMFLERIHLILTNKNPAIERYKAENDPAFEVWRQFGLSPLLEKINMDRENIYHTITVLTPGELSRTGTHKKYGPLTIPQWVEFFLLHEAHHIYTIFQIAHDTEW